MPFEIEIIKWIQQFINPALDQFFQIITMFGEELFYIVLLSLVYWCINKKFAQQLLLAITLSVTTNGFIKEGLNLPRPIGVEGIRSLRTHTAGGASFPSGHTQTAATFFMMMIYKFKNVLVTIFSILMILLVAISRLYLGVHWPKDVVGGIVIALIVVIVSIKMMTSVRRDGNILPFLILLLLTGVSFLFVRTDYYLKSASILIGFLIGYWLEVNLVNFDVHATLEKQVIKYVIGLAGLLGLQFGLKLILPPAIGFAMVRYVVVIVWAMFVAPLIFVKTGLSQHRIFR